MQRILIPVDFSSSSRAAIDYALEIYNPDKYTYVLLHAFGSARTNEFLISIDDIKAKTNIAKRLNDKNIVEYLLKYGDDHPETIVMINTEFGDIKLRLYKDTPLHRANFIFLSKIGYFDSTCFYRVVPDFIIQGGNSERIKTMRYRNKYRNYKMPSEFRPNHKHKHGAIAALCR